MNGLHTESLNPPNAAPASEHKILYPAVNCDTIEIANLTLLRKQVTRKALALSLEEKRELVKFIKGGAHYE